MKAIFIPKPSLCPSDRPNLANQVIIPDDYLNNLFQINHLDKPVRQASQTNQANQTN